MAVKHSYAMRCQWYCNIIVFKKFRFHPPSRCSHNLRQTSAFKTFRLESVLKICCGFFDRIHRRREDGSFKLKLQFVRKCLDLKNPDMYGRCLNWSKEFLSALAYKFSIKNLKTQSNNWKQNRIFRSNRSNFISEEKCHVT